jgi:hypothetical protein
VEVVFEWGWYDQEQFMIYELFLVLPSSSKYVLHETELP